MSEQDKNRGKFIDYVTVSDASAILGVSIDTVRRWEKSGKLHAKRLDGKNRYFAVEELERHKSMQPLSSSEVAVLLGVSTSTVRRLENQGLLAPARNHHGKRLYDRAEVNEYINGRLQKQSARLEGGGMRESAVAFAEVDSTPAINLRDLNSPMGTAAQPERPKGKVKAIHNSGFRFVQRVVVYTVSVGLLLISLFSVLLLVSPASMSQLFWLNENRNDKSDSMVSRLFQPFANRALNVVNVVNPGIKEQIQPITTDDISQLYIKDENGNISSAAGFSPPSSSYLKIPDSNLIVNLNSEFVQGRQPGSAEGELALLPITNSHIKDGTIGGEDIAAGVLQLSHLSTEALNALANGQQQTIVQQPVQQFSGINGITAGLGLFGGGSSGTPTISVKTGSSTEIINNAVEVKLSTLATATTTSVSGLEVNAQGLQLIGGCGTGQLLKWDGSAWTCASDVAGGGSFDVQEGGTTVTSPVAAINFNASDFSVSDTVGQANVVIDYVNSGITRRNQNENIAGTWAFSNVSFSTITGGQWQGSVIGTQYGGTGINGSAAANGRLLIGNGTGYSLAGITQGSGVSVVNGAGSITIAASLGTSIGSSEIDANAVTLGTQTAGDFVENLGALTGLTTAGNSGEGSNPALSVIYGSAVSTAVQGSTQVTCASGTGNLTGGGNTVTLGSGGTCNSLSTNVAVSFATSVTTPLLTNTGNLTLNASGSIVLNGFNCSGLTNGGALTTDASGVLSCSNDDGGAGGSLLGSGTANRIPLYNSPLSLGDSWLAQNGSDLELDNTRNFELLGGNITVNGSVTATSFSGSGASLTNVDAATLNGQTGGHYLALANATGTLSDARLSTNVTLAGNTFNGVSQLVQTTAGGLLPALNGSLITSVDAVTLGGQAGSYYLDLGNAAGTLSIARVGDGTVTNAKLQNSSLTVTAGTGLTAGGSVSLGGSVTLNLADTTVLPNSYGSASSVATFTVDQQGRLSAAGSTAIAIDASQVTTGSFVLGTQTTGDYVANLGSLTGLSTSGNIGEGSAPTLTVLYGAAANTAVQGNTQVTCASGTGNLTGGGTTLTLGTGGSCAAINTNAAVSFATSVTSPLLTNAGGLTLSATGAGNDLTLTAADQLVFTGFDCTSFDNGGVLTVNASGEVTCDNDDGGAAGTITGSGTTNRIPIYTGAQSLGSSWLLQNVSTLQLDNTRNLELLGGNITVNGDVVATGLFGDGSGITNLSAANIAADTLDSARLDTDVTLAGNTFNGNSQLVQTTAGGFLPALNGSLVTNVNSVTLNSQGAAYYLALANATGTLNDARLSTNVTVAGNTFNGVSQLVRLDGSGALPALDGSALTGVNATTLGGQNGAFYLSVANLTGTLNDARLSTNVTLAGNTFNGISQLVQTTAGGLLPALNGSLVTGVDAVTLGSENSAYYLDLANATGTLNIARIADTTVTNAKLQNSAVTVTAGTGLLNGGSVSLGSSVSLAVAYGSTAGTAAQGNTSLTVSAGTNLSGGGSITLGAGGSVTLNTVANPSFATSVTSPLFTNAGQAVLSSTGTGNDVTITSADKLIFTGFDCTAHDNGGVLTVNASGEVICDNDDGGAAGTITGSGSTNRIPLYTGAQSLGSSYLAQNGSDLELDNTRNFELLGGNIVVNGNIGATTFSGSGANLTSLNASNISSDTLADARLSTNVTLAGNSFNGSSQLVQTTIAGLLPALDGSLVTNVDSATLNSQAGSYYLDLANATGTLNIARIADTSLTNAKLQNSGISTSFGTNLSGSGSVSLGGTLSVSLSATPSFTSVDATTFTGALSGNASTATALAANPSDCAANQFANAIAANGNLSCAGITDVDVSNNLTASLFVGSGSTTTAIDLATAEVAGNLRATNLQSTAADLGAADVTINLSNANGSFNTNLILDGTVTATTFIGVLTGNASTAAALAANPSDCSASQFATAIAANGNLTCASLADGDIPDSITIDLATAATALAANPTDCAANQFANAIVANGNLSCAGLADADVPNSITIDLAATASALAANPADCSANQFAVSIVASGNLTCAAIAANNLPSSAADLGAANVTINLSNTNGSFVTNLTLDGTITAATFSGALSGNASTASALAANPSDCAAGQFATAIAANGNLSCVALLDADIPDSITVDLAAAASALAANPSDCAANQFANAIAANGNLTCASLTDADVSNTLTASLFVGSGSTTTAIDLATAEVAGVLPVSNGGTGINASAAGNGQLLIGNGTGYSLGTIANNGGLTISNGAGTLGIAVNYGSGANNAAAGSNTFTCPSGTGNLTGGGTVVTIGASGTVCGSISTNNAVSFSTNVTTPILQNSGALTISANTTAGADDIIMTTAGTEKLRILENGDFLFEKGANDVTLVVATPGTAATYTLSGATGTILTTANYATNLDTTYVNVGENPTAADISGSFSGGFTVNSNSVALGADTTNDYVASLGTLTGLSTTGNSGETSTPTLSVLYGSTTSTAVQGSVQVTCPSGSGNLAGGGTVITLGSGGTCGAISTNNAVSFTTSVTTPLVQNAGLTLSATGANALLLQTNGSTRLTISSAGVATFATNVTVSSGGITVTGNSSIAGTLTGLTGLTVASGGASISGGLNNSSGGITNTGSIAGATTITASGNINTTGVYQNSGVSGVNLDCAANQFFGNSTSSGGIITAATCENDDTGFSDTVLKTNISSVGSKINSIKNLNVVDFNFRCLEAGVLGITLDCSDHTGILAQDIALIFPELIDATHASGYLRVREKSLMYYGLAATAEMADLLDGDGAVNFGSVSTGSTTRISGTGALQNIASITGNGALTVSSGGSGALIINSASNTLVVHSSDSTLQRTAAGSFTVDLNDLLTTTLTVTNSGVGTANINISEGVLQTNGVTRLTNSGVLQNITGLTVSSGGATVSGGFDNNSGGITEAGAISGISGLTTSGSVTFDLFDLVSNTGLTISNSSLTAVANLNLGDGALQTNGTTRLTNAGALQNITTVSASGLINSTTGYQHNGVSGATVSCASNNFLGTQVVRGGIIISGTCETDTAGFSDSRLKENIDQVSSILDSLKDVNVVSYDFKCEEFTELNLSCDRQTGVIAQELELIFPELVSVDEDGFKRVNFEALNFYNLKAVSEIAKMIDSSRNAHFGALSVDGIIEADTLRISHIEGLDYEERLDDLDARVGLLETGGTTGNIDLENLEVGNLTVSLDLLLSGGLTVAGHAQFNGTAFFDKLVTFGDSLLVEGDLSVLGTATFSNNAAGYAVINPGQQSVHVAFSRPYQEVPVITVSLGGGKFARYSYNNVTADGFDIMIDIPAIESLQFSWTATAVSNPLISAQN